MKLKNISFDLSAKPFTDESEETMHMVCRKLFSQWKSLTDTADEISVLLWLADGSEILEYSGDLNQKFEWAYWIGCANHGTLTHNAGEIAKRSTATNPRKYITNPEPRPYSWVKRLIEVIRETCMEMNGKNVFIGAMFDNGPEFAVSEFKYKHHPEITVGQGDFNGVFCNSVLHGDSRKYAAFPNGIPEGTPFGVFFGKQFREFSQDIGYDYIWLGNGMGFGRKPWGIVGALFDKLQFYPENAGESTRTMLEFWDNFYQANPSVMIKTRGTNFSTGIELASEAAPIKALYEKYKIAPPVNSPWAALNFNVGLELSAWMSHIAKLPSDRFMFRYYIHDPWWINSPWLDRYGREPWDIYLPLSIGRVDENGGVATANELSILTVDDSFGNMPDQVPREVTPHLFDAFDNGPDMPGPFILIYPFDEYSECSIGQNKRLGEVLNEDLFLAETIQHGFPLNTVASTEIFQSLMKTKPEFFAGKNLVVPVLALENNFDLIQNLLERGTNILVYGSLKMTTKNVLNLLGLKNTDEITGTVTVQTSMTPDFFEEDGYSDQVKVLPQFDGGGLCEIMDETSGAVSLASATQGESKRVAASVRNLNSGVKVVFLRSMMPCMNMQEFDPEYSGFDYAPTEDSFPVAALARWIAGDVFGWKLQYSAFSGSSRLHNSPYRTNSVMPITTISRHDNAFFYSVYARNNAVGILANSPLGAPILAEMETRILNSDALWNPAKSWHKECRCFVKQAQDSVISCKIQTKYYPECGGRLNYAGMRNAEVRFFPPFGKEESLEIAYDNKALPELSEKIIEVEWENTPYGRCSVLKNITGFLSISWRK